MSLPAPSVAVPGPALSFALPGPVRRLASFSEVITGVGVFAAALATYLVTAPRSVAGSDSAELTTAAASLGIPHPPGYPLYVLVGRVFAAIPIGDVGFRLNLMSAVFGALAALAVYAIVLELTRHRASALVAAFSLAFSYHFWGESLIAEVYTLDAALLGGTVYALCRWERTHRAGTLYAAFFLFGLSLAHRTTSLLLLPPLLMWGLASGSLRHPGVWLRAFAWTLPGLALYLLLPIMYLAHPAYMWNIGYDLSGNPIYADLTTREGLRWYVTAEIFRPLAFAFEPGELWHEVVRYLGWLWGEFMGVGVILGLIGIARACLRHRAFFQLTAGAFALQAWFYINYAAPDKDQMFLPTYLLWALWIGLGTKVLLDLADTGYARALAVPAARALVVAVPVALLAINLPSLDFSGERAIQNDAERLFSAAPADALIIGSWGDIALLQYFQRVEQQRPDLTLVARWSFTDEYLRRLLRANIDRRPIYLLYEAPTLRTDFRLVEAGPWFRLEPLIPQRR